MNTEWNKKPLGELISYISKGIPPKYVEQESKFTIKVLNQKCNKNYSISYENARLHDLSKKGIPKEKMLLIGDILINSTGTGTAGRVAQIFQLPSPTTIDGHMIVLRANDEIDPYYLGYILKAFQKEIELLAEGSTGQTEINRKRLCNEIEIIYPKSLFLQQQISAVFRSIDDKMELNSKINANLEEQAQAIFKSWFVDFEPFGSVMPDDWHIGKLFEISDITMGQSPKGTSYNEKGIGMLFFQGRTDFGNRFPKIRMYTTEPKRTAEKGDILLSVRAPVGDLNIATQKCCIGRGLASIRSKFNHSSFLFYTVFNLKSQFDMFNGEGTVFGSINQKALKEMSVIIPKQKIIDEFERIVSPIDNVIKNNFDEICYLSELRDTLLPKLMNGEIDVSQTKI